MVSKQRINRPTTAWFGGFRLAIGLIVASLVLSGCALWGWGSNVGGELGLGAPPGLVPVDIGLDLSAVSVDEGICGLDERGRLLCRDEGGLGFEVDGPWRSVSTSPWRDVVCAIADSDATLWCGSIRSAPAQVSAAAWKMVSLGQDLACGIRTDDTLWCWTGRVADAVQIGSARWTTVSVAQFDTYCGLQVDGSRWCGGRNNGINSVSVFGFDSPDVPWTTPAPANDGSWSDLEMQDSRGCGLRDDASLWCWGFGNLGIGPGSFFGDQHQSDLPVRVGTAGWRTIELGPEDSCGIQLDGSLWCWGVNRFATVGNGTLDSQATPFQITGGPWAEVSVGRARTCATTADLRAWCWGGHVDKVSNPAVINPGTWGQVAAGSYITCGIALDQSLWCWGANQPVGDNNLDPDYAPTQIGGASWIDVSVTTVDAFAVGSRSWPAHACGVQTDNTLHCWGSGASGQLGGGDRADQLVPTPVGGNDWAQVSVGLEHTCAIKLDATLWCWGSADEAAVGTGGISGDVDGAYDEPVQIGSATWRAVSAGERTTCGIQTDDSLWCWGSNFFGGLLGDPSLPDPQAEPARIGSASWAQIDIGVQTICGRQTDDSLWCWGNSYPTGPQQTPTRVDSELWQTVSVGAAHICGLRADSTLWCWGNNQQGELGRPSPVRIPTPAQVGTETWTDVEAGGERTFGLRSAPSANGTAG